MTAGNRRHNQTDLMAARNRLPETIRRRTALGLLAAGGLSTRLARAAPPLATIPPALTMATGEPGGGFAIYGPDWGQHAGAAAHVALSYRSSGGSAANILLIEQGQVQLGMTMLAVAAQAWKGQAPWTGLVPMHGFRALFPVFPTSLQIFAPIGGGVRQLRDLKGARIGVGPAGGAGAAIAAKLLVAAGAAPRMAITGLYGEQIGLLRAKKIDACAFMGMTPMPAIRAVARRGGFNLIGGSPAQLAAMQRTLPGLRPTIIPADSLPGQTAAVATIGSSAIVIGRADLPNALVETLTTSALARHETLRGTKPVATSASRDWIDGDDEVLIHPGAVAALRHYGYAAPAHLISS